MKLIFLILMFVTWQAFAIDDASLAAAGDWSQPVANESGVAIRGRLLICDTPNHASRDWTDRAVYLELQEFSFALQRVRVYCDFSGPDEPGFHCELRDSTGKVVPNSPFSFSGGEPYPSWVMLQPYCSARLRASAFGGGGLLKDGGLSIFIGPTSSWDVHPNPTNDYYLSGTFTASMPTNRVNPTNMDIWYGTLTLPPVKIPVKKQ